MILFHYGTTYATSYTSRHLNKTLVQLSAFNIFYRSNTIIDTIKSNIRIFRKSLFHRFQHTAGSWEKSCSAELVRIIFLFKFDLFTFEPFCKLFESENSISNTFVMLRFVLLCHTRSYKNGLCSRKALFYITAMSLHGRHNVCQIFQNSGIVLLYQKINRMTTRSNNDIPFFLPQHTFILIFYDSCTHRSFFNIVKSEFFHSLPHRVNANAFIICNKRRRKACNNGNTALEKNSDLFSFINNFFCILRTDNKTLSA